jgi:cell division inhibitor SulA
MSKDNPHRFERITPRVSMRRGFLHLVAELLAINRKEARWLALIRQQQLQNWLKTSSLPMQQLLPSIAV